MKTAHAVIWAIVFLAAYAAQSWYWHQIGYMAGETAGIRWAAEQLKR